MAAVKPIDGSPAQQMVRGVFREAVYFCKNPANRAGKKFQRCVGDYIKAKLAERGHVPRKKKVAHPLYEV